MNGFYRGFILSNSEPSASVVERITLFVFCDCHGFPSLYPLVCMKYDWFTGPGKKDFLSLRDSNLGSGASHATLFSDSVLNGLCGSCNSLASAAVFEED